MVNRHRKTSIPIDTTQLPRVTDLPLTTKFYTFYEHPAYSNFDNKTGLIKKDTNTIDDSVNYSRILTLHKVEYHRSNHRTDLRYGDFVQIRSFGNQNNQSSANG